MVRIPLGPTGSNERCLIYLITCNRCLNQYASQTVVGEFRHRWHRWNNYKDNARKFEKGEHCMQRHLYEHLNLPDHLRFLNDVSHLLIRQTLMILIKEKIPGFTHLKPMGLIVEDCLEDRLYWVGAMTEGNNPYMYCPDMLKTY